MNVPCPDAVKRQWAQSLVAGSREAVRTLYRDMCGRQLAAIDERLIEAQESRPSPAPWILAARRQWAETLGALNRNIQP